MDIKSTIFYCYAVIGLLFILFSSAISNFFYKIVLLYTNRMNLQDLFFFKVDHSNRDSLYSLARAITIFLGLIILGTSLYIIYF